MESSGQRPPEPEVPLADAAIATEIANAAARGRGADRAPTLEQLLAAFGEGMPTPAARTRVAAALRVAGMGVKPDLASAEPGQRLVLLPPGVSEGRSRGRAALGLVAVIAVVAIAAAGASLLENKGGDDKNVADNLPAESTSAVPGSTQATETEPVTTPTETTATTATTPVPETGSDTTATATTTTSAAEEQAAADARRKRAAKLKRRREAAAKKKRAAANAVKLVTVRVDASGRPSFLCVEDGAGRSLFSGTLDGKQVFKAKRVRMNIGLKSTAVTVNGNPVRLDGSPAGLDITRAGGAKSLPLGKRPCG
jgi:hypothetical protein